MATLAQLTVGPWNKGHVTTKNKSAGSPILRPLASQSERRIYEVPLEGFDSHVVFLFFNFNNFLL